MIRRPPRSTRTDTLFPTRRSSDLRQCPVARQSLSHGRGRARPGIWRAVAWVAGVQAAAAGARSPDQGRHGTRLPADCRSEEHTSELQSLMRISYAVFCLTKKHNNYTQPPQLQVIYKYRTII